VTFSIGSGGSNPVFVDESQAYQQIEGFGASFTDPQLTSSIKWPRLPRGPPP